jgi:PPE-repeat protein
MKGYKIFNPDMKCLGFQFEVGKTYKIEGELKMCENGFHFCKELKDCYEFYSFDYKNPFCEIETGLEVLEDEKKCCCSEIRIVKKLDLSEILEELNLFCSSNRGSSNRGSDNIGSFNKGSFNKGSDNTGSSNRGSFNTGSFNTGSFNTGSSNRGSFNRGSDNRGSSNRGSDNRGSFNTGSDNTGSFNTGSSNRGSDNIGSDNRGSDNRGSFNTGSFNTGSSNRGSDNRGSDNRGSDNRGSFNTGSFNTGSFNTGTECFGYFNTISFLGNEKECYCFNKKTGLSLKEFQDKYSEIINEIEKYDFSNIIKLPNWTQKKHNLLKEKNII